MTKHRHPLLLWLALLLVVAQANGETTPEGEYQFFGLRMERRSGEAATTESAKGRLLFDQESSFLVDSQERHAFARESEGIVILNSFLPGFGALDARVTSDGGALMGVAEGLGGGSVALVVAVRPAREVSPAIFRDTYQAVLVTFPGEGGGAEELTFASFEAAQSSLSLGTDGTGTLTIPPGSGLSASEFEIAVSEDGSLMIGAPSTEPGLLIALRKGQLGPQGLLWLTELSIGRSGPAAAVGGMVLATPNRAHIYELWVGPRGASDYRGENSFVLQTDGTGLIDTTAIVSGEGGALLGAKPGFGSGSLLVGLPAPTPLPTKVFANPHGNVSAASLSPAGDPVAPSQLRSLFGTDLASASAAAESLPLPTSLLGASITLDDIAAPLLFVSPGQINFQVPPDASGPRVKMVARNGEDASESILARLASTSAAVFALDASGAGTGIFTHLDFSLVSTEAPARPGETIVGFLTGLGVGQPPPTVWIGGAPGEVLYAGPAPGFAGLDQINLRLPSGAPLGPAVPFSISTREGWSDTVTIPIAP